MTTLVIRNLEDSLGAALKREAAARVTSVNKLVQHYIATGLQRDSGAHANAKLPRNDLQRFAGTWSAKEHAEFTAATQVFGEIEPDAWK